MVKKQNCVIWILTGSIYKDIAEDVETKFDASNHKLDRPLPKGKHINVVGLMKDELGGKIMIKFVGLRTKTDGKKTPKRCVIEIKLKLENYKNCLEATQLGHKMNHLKKINFL